MNTAIFKFGLMCIACASLGWITGGIADEALSYIIDIIGGLGIWYVFFGEIL